MDFTPFYRSSIGFDRVFSLLENANRLRAIDNWPPYDIARLDENTYRVTVAVAGFSQDDLEISYEPNLLIITGELQDEACAEFLHRGLTSKSFVRRFEIADHMKVSGATIRNGLLTIELAREVPEAMRPRRIEIAAGREAPHKTEHIETEQAA
jgi:molecular chaperone IbpA